MHSKFQKDWFRHSKVERGGIYRQQDDLISLLLFFQNKKSRLKIGNAVPERGAENLRTIHHDGGPSQNSKSYYHECKT
jgi:hypothetical protein